ncbi:hypothetical protein GFB49_11645 [Epibacterium sp. SM1979]|uniref:Bacteriophage tail tape measure N-terminal domain-containing protein n=1 Tax=Tritonibacter litoralis TaxID=2662264 RepID=A0A843YCQ2_9RHOB|nr:phage tail length tape measure family protein [Tritonibacter litoralis]MQQ09110.1 hypothetical protein [Tritonibacter litoralis]
MFGKVKDLFFNITGRDQSGPAFGSVNRRLRETDALAASVSERTARAGRSMQRFGAAGTLATGAVALAFRDVIGLYDEQARAEAKVAQAVRQTGGAAGFTAAQLNEQASALQDLTRFGDEDILNKVTAQLLTFGNVSGQIFTDAQSLALDLATTLDGDLQSASIMLGKALNDPVKGLSAMSRAGITFSETQAEVIKDLAKTGDIAEAQRLILDEIATYYGGQAAAARDAGAGIVDAWSNTWGDVKEIVGGVIVDTLPPIIAGLKDLIGWFTDLTPEGQKTVVMFGALAVAIPPVTAAIGLMAVGVSALMGPVGLIAAGLAAITGAAIALTPEQTKLSTATDNVTLALGDEITQSQLLSEVLGTSTRMSLDAANKKLDEARARHENVKAIVAEQRALKLQSSDYQDILGAISDTENALNSLGFPSIDVAPARSSEAFEDLQLRMVELRKQQQEFLRAGTEYEDQLKRTEENIRSLEEAIADAAGGTVTLGGDDLITPISPGDRADTPDTPGGGGGVANALRDIGSAIDETADADGWDVVKGNLRALLFEGQSFGDTFANVVSSALDRLFDLAFSPAWDALFDNLSESFSGTGGGSGGGGLLQGLFSGANNFVGNILGLDTGGDVTVSGKAGIDRNLTVLRTSDAEQVSVRRPGDMGGMGRAVNVYIQTPDPQAFQASRAQIGQQISRAVAVGNRAT